MLGNPLGWIISLVIAGLSGFLGYTLVQKAGPTPPTGWVQATVKPLELADPIKALLPPMTDLKDDAGDLCRQAIADVQNHETEYTEMQTTRTFDEAQVAELKGFDDIVKAGTCPTMNLLASKPDEAVGYATSVDALDKLDILAKAMENVIILSKYENRYDVASKFSNALMALGYHLYVERVAYCELSAGYNYLGAGSDSLVEIAKAVNSSSKREAQLQFKVLRGEEFNNRILPVLQVITAEGQDSIAMHAGDMFQLATDPSDDRVWRVEAIRRLGRLQLNSPSSLADQLKASKVLDRLSKDKDLVIATAAAKARAITAYDNQGQR